MRATAERRGKPERRRTRQGQERTRSIVNPRRGYPDRVQTGGARSLDLSIQTRQDLLKQIGGVGTTGPVLTAVITATRVYPWKHYLARQPGVFVYDSSGDQIEVHVQHIDDDTLQLDFVGTLTNATVDLY